MIQWKYSFLAFLCGPFCLGNLMIIVANAIDCRLPEYSLDNTIVLGMSNDKLYQYTNQHLMVVYPRPDQSSINPNSTALFHLTNGILREVWMNNEVLNWMNPLSKITLAVRMESNIDTLYYIFKFNSQFSYQCAIFGKYFKKTLHLSTGIRVSKIIPISNLKFTLYNPFWLLVIDGLSKQLYLFNNAQFINKNRVGKICLLDNNSKISLKPVNSKSCSGSSIFDNIISGFQYKSIVYLVSISKGIVYSFQAGILLENDVVDNFNSNRLTDLFDCDLNPDMANHTMVPTETEFDSATSVFHIGLILKIVFVFIIVVLIYCCYSAVRTIIHDDIGSDMTGKKGSELKTNSISTEKYSTAAKPVQDKTNTSKIVRKSEPKRTFKLALK